MEESWGSRSKGPPRVTTVRTEQQEGEEEKKDVSTNFIGAASPGSRDERAQITAQQIITNNHLRTPWIHLSVARETRGSRLVRGGGGVRRLGSSVHAPYAAPLSARRSYWACVLAETNSNARLLQPSQSSLQPRTFPPRRNYCPRCLFPSPRQYSGGNRSAGQPLFPTNHSK